MPANKKEDEETLAEKTCSADVLAQKRAVGLQILRGFPNLTIKRDEDGKAIGTFYCAWFDVIQKALHSRKR